MGQVIPFIARVRESGDWSEAERARLEELADRLSAAGIRVDVAFGATDEGDPWCAVTDEDGEVLIHVARIGGTFVVHSAFDDSLNEGADLHDALRDQLQAAGDWETTQPSAEILPFEARRAQTFLALVAATAFLYEAGAPTPVHAAEAPPAPEATHEPSPPPTLPVTEDREVAIQGAAVSDPTHVETQATSAPTTEAASIETTSARAEPEPQAETAPAAHAAAPEVSEAPSTAALAAQTEAPREIHGTDGDDRLVGSTQSEVLLGGAGADTLQGGGGQDTLDGGAGDDRIEVTADVVAIGGQGADVFVIRPPPGFGHPDQLLGRIVDFSQAEGDRVLNWRGDHIPLPPNLSGGPPGEHGFGVSTYTTTTRVEVDLDGDGKVDGYLLFGADGRPPPPPPVTEAPPAPDDQPITIVGHTLAWHDPGT